MLIGDGIDKGVVDAVEVAAIFPIAGPVVRTADNKGAPPLAFPSCEQAPQFPVHITERCRMAL